MTRLALAALSLLLAGCQTIPTAACDVHYSGPPPAELVRIGWSLNPMIVDLPPSEFAEQCPGTPIACADAKRGIGWYFVIVTEDASQWERHGLTRDQVITHEVGHLAEIYLHADGNYCHTGWRV